MNKSCNREKDCKILITFKFVEREREQKRKKMRG